MAKKRTPLPKLSGPGPRPYEHEGTNENTGVSRFAYFCEGCGRSKVIPDTFDFDSDPPIFWSERNGGCGCRKRRELTDDYFEPCRKCSDRVYLTPRAAMYRKEHPESYEQKYCDSCLDEIVVSVPCRNAGCESIGGKGLVEATFGQQLSYTKDDLIFPPTNCEVCRAAKNAFKRHEEVRPTCQLCKKPFRVPYGVMIMILKIEEQCEVPKECLRCRGLGPDERRRLDRENELDDLSRQRRDEVVRVLAGDKKALADELANLAAAKVMKKVEFVRLLNQKLKLERKDTRAVLQTAMKDGLLLEILANPNNARYRQVQLALATVTGGEAKMTDQEFSALPKAVYSIVKDHPEVMGLFEKAPDYRAPGMSAVNQHYEVLSTAALKSREFTTQSGKKLRVYNIDSVAFGIKFPQHYAQPKRFGTIEADTLIHRGVLPLFLKQKTIGIDAKYTKEPSIRKYEIRSDNLAEFKRQLSGIRNNFNDDNLQEFHFVTNGEFGKTFKEQVEDTNIRLVRDFITKHNQQFDTEEGMREISYLTPEEREPMPEGKVELGSLDNLRDYTSDVQEFADKYEIKQVELCEHVTYD